MTLRVASWNVLANAYLWPDIYARCDADALDPTKRRARVVEQIAKLDADVVALQEADRELVDALDARFADWSVAFAKKGEGKLDGCALLVAPSLIAPRSNRTRLELRLREHAYDDGTGHVVAVADIDGPRGRLLVVTTHLKWDRAETPLAQRVGLAQAKRLFEIVRAAREAHDAPCIVCGDFNATADDAIIGLFTSAGFVDAYATMPNAFTAVANGRARRIDFLLVSRDLRAVPDATVPLHDDDALPSLTLPSDHAPICVSVDA